jgi:hypothetical protein
MPEVDVERNDFRSVSQLLTAIFFGLSQFYLFQSVGMKLLGLSETVCDIHAADLSGVSAVSGRATIWDCPAVKFLVCNYFTHPKRVEGYCKMQAEAEITADKKHAVFTNGRKNFRLYGVRIDFYGERRTLTQTVTHRI